MALAVTSIVVLAGLALLPVRTWLSQRETRAELSDDISRAQGQVAELDAQLTLLETDAEIERLARENFDLVFPGEESYRILPAPED